MTILQCYHEFAKSNCNVESAFYKYATGDIITESELYNKLLLII